MKAKLLLKPHVVLEDEHVVEVWHDNKLICTITGYDGPGVRIISKHPVKTTNLRNMITDVIIDTSS